ncbi:MAG TPA: metal ABC transporter permease, partial [Anaerolineales bacterium]
GAGALLSRRIEAMMSWAALIGSLSVYTGLSVSYYFNLAAGSSIVLVAVLIFFIVLIAKNMQLSKHPGMEGARHD